MYIEPNTNIRILKDVPLNNTYKHTIYFSKADYQRNYFIGKTKHNLTNQTYQRVNKGVARVGVKAELLYDCNYMMFQNTNFGDKWFYAFITSVEYINNAVSEITFEIDVLQTWYFDYQVKECFVEREHSATDVAGDNVVAEAIDIGDLICHAQAGSGLMDSYVAVVGTAYDTDGMPGGTVGGLFTGLKYVAGLIDNATQVNALLEYLQAATEANKADSIVSIWVMPSKFYTSENEPVVQVKKVAKNTKLGDYTPRNKKLLTYPYNYLGVDCGNNSCVYRYEWFKANSDNTCQFTLTSAVTPNPEIALIPMDYNGSGLNTVEKLLMNGFPQVGYAIDAFRAWLAQEASSTALSIAGSLAGAGLGVATSNPYTAMYGAVGVAQGINSIVLASNRPPQAKGSNGGSVDTAMRSKDFYFRQMQITPQYARILDDFFDVYGYATQRVKVPNICDENAPKRPYWNYTKTKDCVVVGSLPTDDMKKICSIFDSGVTFWTYPANLGNYSFTNSPQASEASVANEVEPKDIETENVITFAD